MFLVNATLSVGKTHLVFSTLLQRCQLNCVPSTPEAGVSVKINETKPFYLSRERLGIETENDFLEKR
jgi:hypothetical protein